MINGLYVLTPECADTEKLLDQVRQALSGGAKLVQYRNKEGDVALRHEQASELQALCSHFQVPLIINDDIRLADLVGADGVHLGKDDGSVREARLILGPEKIIGVSCYNDLQRALDAENQGANYVAFGSFFPSSTKPDAAVAPLTLLHEAKQSLSIPIVAIGGITADNVASLIEAGADSVAVITAIFAINKDIKTVSSQIATLFETSFSHTLH